MNESQLICGVSGMIEGVALVVYEQIAVQDKVEQTLRLLFACFTFLLAWSILAAPPRSLDDHLVGVCLLSGLHLSTAALKIYLSVLAIRRRKSP